MDETPFNGALALQVAVHEGLIDTLIPLLYLDAVDINEPLSTERGALTPLMIACNGGHASIVRILLNRGADVSATADHGVNALHLSVLDGNLETVTLLVEAGADLNAVISGIGHEGATPLHLATNNGHLEVMEALLKAGADSESKDGRGHTPLLRAAQNGQVEVVTALIAAGADLEATSPEGHTPLHLAAWIGRSAVLRALIDAGANFDTRLPSGETPLYSCAASSRGLDMVRMLLDVKANPLLTKTHSDGGAPFTPLEAAATRGHVQIVGELIQRVGIEGCGGACGGGEALRCAAEEAHVGVMAMLTDAGVTDTRGALATAAECGAEAAIRFLLQQQERKSADGVAAYVNTGNPARETPLLCAVCYSRFSPRVVRLLVEAGADTTSAFGVTNDLQWDFVQSDETPLDFTARILREKKFAGEDVTEEDLYGLEGIRRLLLRVEAVHAVSFLWPVDAPSVIGTTEEGTSRKVAPSPPLRMMLPILRRRARRPRVLLAALFRSVIW